MNPNLPIDHLLDEFLQGRLSKEVLQNQLPELPATALDEEIKLHRAATLYMQKAPALTQVAQIHEQFLRENKTSKKEHTARIVSWTKWMGIAASLLLVAGLLYWQLGTTPNAGKLYSELYVAYTVPVYRAETTQSTQLVALYQEHNTSQLIATYEKEQPTNNQSHLLAGLSYMSRKDWSLAATTFQQIIRNNGAGTELSYLDEAQYYAALTYLQAGDYSKSLELFRIIAADAQHTYHRQLSAGQLAELETLVRK